jgi:hypothetical protein
MLLGRGKNTDTTCVTLAFRSALFRLSTKMYWSVTRLIHGSDGVKSSVTLWTPKIKSVVEDVLVVEEVTVVDVTVEDVVVVVVVAQLKRSDKVKFRPLLSAPPLSGSLSSALSTHSLSCHGTGGQTSVVFGGHDGVNARQSLSVVGVGPRNSYSPAVHSEMAMHVRSVMAV